jgi:pyruvate/2-oxoglutarate dehydrogenase complex dihydrolipoamide dehydrogenase (E3) component
MTVPAKGEGNYNVVVIGAGTAGLVTAAGTAGLGGRVALIERNQMGGDCLNFGCVPSKALISSARLIDKIRRASAWGLRPMEAQFDFNEVFAAMRERRAGIAPNDSQERFESLGVDVFRGQARFESANSVQVGDRILRAKNFVIATGTRTAVPQVDGIDSAPYFTNETIFDDLKSKPESLIVLGGGPIGCELGQTFHRLGVRTTIVQRGPQLLPREDPEVAEFLEKGLTNEGISVVTNAEARAVRSDGGITLSVTRQDGSAMEISAATLLVCSGRRPNIEGLGLDTIGVEAGEKGVRVNDYLQTSRPHIYAAGDIAGPFLFTHMADAQARVVVRNILMPLQFLRQKMNYAVVPWCTYVDPEIASVGLNETAAKQRNVAYDLIRLEIKEVDRAVVEREETGFVKVLVAKGTDRILGATLVCENAGDLLHEFVLAMKYGIGLGKISATTHAYPTFAELARKAGDKYNKSRLTPSARRVFGWLYRTKLR